MPRVVAIVWALALGLGAAGSCTSKETPRPSADAKAAATTPPLPPPAVMTRASLLHADNLGKRITLVGEAQDRKDGACLVSEQGDVWIPDWSRWPEDLGHGGVKVKLTGTLGEDHGRPVFVPNENEPVVQGVPVEPGTDLDAASHRFIIQDPTFERVR